jgi:hypothetical protein
MKPQTVPSEEPKADRVLVETSMRTSDAYREHLARHRSRIWYGDRYYQSPLEIAALLPQIASIGRYYDVHFEDAATTFEDAEGTSSIVHLVPTTSEALYRKGEGLLRLAGSYDGILGRAPDYVGTMLALWRQAGAFFAETFQDSVGEFADRVRRQDLYITHTTTDITDRNGHPAGIRVVRESAEGLEVATLGPHPDAAGPPGRGRATGGDGDLRAADLGAWLDARDPPAAGWRRVAGGTVRGV